MARPLRAVSAVEVACDKHLDAGDAGANLLLIGLASGVQLGFHIEKAMDEVHVFLLELAGFHGALAICIEVVCLPDAGQLDLDQYATSLELANIRRISHGLSFCFLGWGNWALNEILNALVPLKHIRMDGCGSGIMVVIVVAVLRRQSIRGKQ